MTQYITLTDFILFPFVFLLIFRLAVVLRDRWYKPGDPMRPYFVPALMFKILGSAAFAIVYQYYYGYGDTFYFFDMGRFFSKIVVDNPVDFFKVYISGGDDYFIPKSYLYNFDYLYNHHIATVIVGRFSSFIGLLTFNNYLFTTIGFSILSFSGLWKLFKMFSTLYPQLSRPLAWAILFVPSVIFWGSGLLKDSITLGSLGWLTYACWSLFFQHKRITASIFVVLLTMWILIQIKSYILLSFLPAIMIWIGAAYYKKIRNPSMRVLAWPVVIGVVVFMALQVADLLTTDEGSNLSIETITTAALNTNYGIQLLEAGSTYSLGTIAPTFGDMLLKAPLAAVTALFRPFLWEVKNIVMLFSALESFLVLILTVTIIARVGVIKAVKITFTNSLVFFCFFFSIVFSIGVAISSGNFGTLVRYKLPAMPFYFIFLMLLYYYSGKMTSVTPVVAASRKKRRVVAEHVS